MDKTTKLIFWQRLAIAWLIVATITTALILRDEQQSKARIMVYLQRFAQSQDQLKKQHDDDQRVIGDLDKRLKQYEARYGEIQPVRQGEGVWLNGKRVYYFGGQSLLPTGKQWGNILKRSSSKSFQVVGPERP